jgi:hypothetical protein
MSKVTYGRNLVVGIKKQMREFVILKVSKGVQVYPREQDFAPLFFLCRLLTPGT